MRTIDEIKKELEVAEARCLELKKELEAVRLQEFLRISCVPPGAQPIFENRKGEKVMVYGFDGHWPVGRLIRKDGKESSVRRVLFESDHYEYAGG